MFSAGGTEIWPLLSQKMPKITCMDGSLAWDAWKREMPCMDQGCFGCYKYCSSTSACYIGEFLSLAGAWGAPKAVNLSHVMFAYGSQMFAHLDTSWFTHFSTVRLRMVRPGDLTETTYPEDPPSRMSSLQGAHVASVVSQHFKWSWLLDGSFRLVINNLDKSW